MYHSQKANSRMRWFPYSIFILVLLFSSCYLSNRWQYEKDVIITNGIETHALRDGKGLLVSQNAVRRVDDAKLVPISAYHALILVNDPLWEPSGSEVTRLKAETLTRLKWISKNGEKKSQNLEIKFDGETGRLVVGDENFSLVESNLFLIRIGSGWSVTSQQIRREKINAVLEMHELLNEIKRITGDSEICDLELAE